MSTMDKDYREHLGLLVVLIRVIVMYEGIIIKTDTVRTS